MRDFHDSIAEAKAKYLDDADDGGLAEAGEAYSAVGGSADERLEQVVYTRFLDRDAPKEFFSAYKDIEALWEILSSSAELRDYIDTFKCLTQLYAVVRNAYADHPCFVADPAHKTRRLVGRSVEIHGLGILTKSVTFDLRTLAALRREPDRTRLRCSTWSVGFKRRQKASLNWSRCCGLSRSAQSPC